MKMKNIKIVAGLFLLTICSYKATCSDKPMPEWFNDYGFSSNGLLMYRLAWNPERSESTIEIVPKSEPGKLYYATRCNDIRIFSKEQITESLSYFHDRIKEYGTHYITIVGDISEEELGGVTKSKKLKELILDKSLLTNYFAGMDSLDYIELYVMNLGAKLHMCRDGTLEEYWNATPKDEYWVKIPRKSRWDVSPESEA